MKFLPKMTKETKAAVIGGVFTIVAAVIAILATPGQRAEQPAAKAKSSPVRQSPPSAKSASPPCAELEAQFSALQGRLTRETLFPFLSQSYWRCPLLEGDIRLARDYLGGDWWRATTTRTTPDSNFFLDYLQVDHRAVREDDMDPIGTDLDDTDVIQVYQKPQVLPNKARYDYVYISMDVRCNKDGNYYRYNGRSYYRFGEEEAVYEENHFRVRQDELRWRQTGSPLHEYEITGLVCGQIKPWQSRVRSVPTTKEARSLVI